MELTLELGLELELELEPELELEKGLELEADPRHAKLVVKELRVENANPSSVPGSKTEAKRKSG